MRGHLAHLTNPRTGSKGGRRRGGRSWVSRSSKGKMEGGEERVREGSRGSKSRKVRAGWGGGGKGYLGLDLATNNTEKTLTFSVPKRLL